MRRLAGDSKERIRKRHEKNDPESYKANKISPLTYLTYIFSNARATEPCGFPIRMSLRF